MVNKNNKRLSPMLIAMILAGGAFVYGVVVGRYQVFPYAHLQAARMYFVDVQRDEPRELVPVGRQVNYQNRVDIHRLYEVDTDVVMVGDSITDYAEWSELFPSVSISNRGIAGDTAEGILRRMDSVIATGAKTAFIMIGVNDIIDGQSAETVFAHYKRIIEQLLANGVQPYVQSTILVGDRRKDKNAEIKALNDRLQDYVAAKGLEFIDLNSRLSADGVLDGQFTADSIHLNAAGYRVWKDLLDPVMEEHVKILQTRANTSRTEPIGNR